MAAINKKSDEEQYAEAVHAMENGDDNAKTKVAFYRLTGRGGAVIDVAGAIALLQERGKKKDPDAMWMLGLCYAHGLGIEQDLERTRKLYQQSSQAGNAVANFLIESSGISSQECTFRNIELRRLCMLISHTDKLVRDLVLNSSNR